MSIDLDVTYNSGTGAMDASGVLIKPAPLMGKGDLVSAEVTYEVLDKNGNPLPTPQSGKATVTNLLTFTIPTVNLDPGKSYILDVKTQWKLPASGQKAFQ